MNLFYFLSYRVLNSLFFGISGGSIFVIYASLPPITYSIGGVVVALGSLAVARYYERLFNTKCFFITLYLVESISLFIVLSYLIFGTSWALVIYISYQATFIFGGYILRNETQIIQNVAFLSKLDSYKQISYILGLGISALLYMILKSYGIADSQAQIFYLHIVLLPIQALVMISLYKSYRFDEKGNILKDDSKR